MLYTSVQRYVSKQHISKQIYSAHNSHRNEFNKRPAFSNFHKEIVNNILCRSDSTNWCNQHVGIAVFKWASMAVNDVIFVLIIMNWFKVQLEKWNTDRIIIIYVLNHTLGTVDDMAMKHNFMTSATMLCGNLSTKNILQQSISN